MRAVSGGAFLRVLRYPFVMLSMALLPRLMGDASYGEYAYYMSIFLVLDIFTDIGVIQMFGRFIPECLARGDRDGARNLLHGSLTFSLGLTGLLITGILLYTSFFPIPNFRPQWTLALCLQLLFTQTEGILFSFIYSLNRIERYSLKEIYRSAFTFCFVFLMYLFFGLDGALWGLVMNAFLLALIALRWTWPWLVEQPVTITPKAYLPYLLFGVQFYIPAFFYGLMQRSGNVFVRHFSNAPDQVAYYDVANQLLLLLSQFLCLILSTLIPSLTHLHARNEQNRIDQWQGKALTCCLVIAFFAFNALVWFGDQVITLVFGADYAPVYPNAIIAMLGMAALLPASVGMNYSLLRKEPWVYTSGVSLGLAVMAGGSILAVPIWKAAGASAATTLGYIALSLFFMVKYRKRFRGMMRPILAVIGSAMLLAPAYLIKPRLGLPGGVALFALTSAFYAVLMLFTRTLTLDDARQLIRAYRKK
ncbi:MAG: oligosaccharide flippase family protein [Kiritimatiellae bacterium]|nr:oligosaccharide flippase family protein [Kiritimatiellia bacterium]